MRRPEPCRITAIDLGYAAEPQRLTAMAAKARNPKSGATAVANGQANKGSVTP